MSNIGSWTFAADGNGSAQVLTHTRIMQLDAQGTFGGGTITAQFSTDGGTTWRPVNGVSLTSNNSASVILYAVQGDQFRPVLTGSTAPSVTVVLRETVAR